MDLPVGDYDPPRLAVPTLTVDTTDWAQVQPVAIITWIQKHTGLPLIG